MAFKTPSVIHCFCPTQHALAKYTGAKFLKPTHMRMRTSAISLCFVSQELFVQMCPNFVFI